MYLRLKVYKLHFPQYFKEMQQNFVSMQPPDKQGLLAKCFENLMTDVEPNLLGKNRDR